MENQSREQPGQGGQNFTRNQYYNQNNGNADTQTFANQFGGNLNTNNRVINVNINGVPAQGNFDLNGLLGQIGTILNNNNIGQVIQDSMNMAMQQAANIQGGNMPGQENISQNINIVQDNSEGDSDDGDDDDDDDDSDQNQSQKGTKLFELNFRN